MEGDNSAMPSSGARRDYHFNPPSSFQPLNVEGPGGFGCYLSDLTELIAQRDTNGIERFRQRFGGIHGLAQKLRTDLQRGIKGTPSDLKNRTKIFGPNHVPAQKPKTLLRLMYEAATNPILIILTVCGIISLVLGATLEKETSGWLEGLAIIISVTIVIVVSAVNDLQKERQFQQLQAKQSEQLKVDVIRSNEEKRINVHEIVVGDIVMISTGVIIPADGVLIHGSNLFTDESALTGEPRDVPKSAHFDPWLLSGTSVKKGCGTMIVTGVGVFSEEGIIQKLITKAGWDISNRLETIEKEARRAAPPPSAALTPQHARGLGSGDDGLQPQQQVNMQDNKVGVVEKQERIKAKKSESVLQRKLTRMTVQIGYVGTAAAIIIVLILMTRYAVEEFAIKKRSWEHDDWSELLSLLIIGVTVLVVAVPEGLPLAVTISLAYSAKRMMHDNNLVRVLAACETMGNATTICCDKTGTLTKNRMVIVKAWAAGEIYASPRDMRHRLSDAARQRFVHNAAYNSSHESQYFPDPKGGLPVQHGDNTECACLHLLDAINDRNYQRMRIDLPPVSYIKEYPFDSEKKYMATVIPLANGTFRLLVKGAPEVLMSRCTHTMDAQGRSVPLDDATREELEQSVILGFAEDALRVILLAHRDMDAPANWDNEPALLHDLTLTLLVGIQDPVRDEVPEAVAACQRAGVVVRMLTGDNMVTARAIAINCGIIRPDDEFIVMEGPEFRARTTNPDGSLNYEEMNRIWPNLRVMGRCSPSDKYNLVRGLIKAGEVVAVTGDGTNDGPALSEADVGFAMGIAGTGVARQAADIIITDDNFSSIVKALAWGRNVYSNITKFLVFQLTVNVVAIIVAFVGACAIDESPLRAVQMLWVNLIMDSIAALALSTERPTPELLNRAPYGRSAPLLNQYMLRQILGHAVYQLAVLFLLLFYGDKMFHIRNGRLDAGPESDRPTIPDRSQHYTIIFNTFVMMQVFNLLNSRTQDLETIDTKTRRSRWTAWRAFLYPWRGMHRNAVFVGVLLVIIAGQVLIVQFGGRALNVVSLTGTQWAACIVFGAGSLVWNIILHYIFPWTWIPKRLEAGRSPDAETKRHVHRHRHKAFHFHRVETEPVDVEALASAFAVLAAVGSPVLARRVPASTPAKMLWARAKNLMHSHLRRHNSSSEEIFYDAQETLSDRTPLLP